MSKNSKEPWVEDWEADLLPQENENELAEIYERYTTYGNGLIAELSAEEILLLLTAQRINHRRDVVDRAKRAGLI